MLDAVWEILRYSINPNFAVSLDKNRDEWIKLIEDYKLNWLNVSDLKGWSGKAMLDYFIYATPTMFLVDKNRTLISKPMTNDEVANLFNN